MATHSQHMASEAVEIKKGEEHFWRDFPAMTDYFSPAIQPLLRYLGVTSKDMMHELGVMVGRNAGARLSNRSPRKMLDEFARIWEDYKIGRLSIESEDPLVLQISNCSVCGQLPGTGEMYECAFHEGFFQGAQSERLGREVKLRQQTNYEGEAGTWCRRLVTDVRV